MVQAIGFYTRRLVDTPTALNFQQWFEENNIPNSLPLNQLHCSVITAEAEIPGYRPDRFPVLIRPKQFSIKILNAALVVAFDSPMLKRSWLQAVATGIGLKYPTFLGHVSVSYAVPIDFDVMEVKPPTFPIRLLPEESAPVTSFS